MPRIRTIKPEHWNDKELAKINLSAHLLWIGLWTFADDEGIFEQDIHLIRSQVFPRRTDIRIEQIEQWIGQLVNARFVIPFEYNGSGYYIHRTFKAHQKIEKPKKSKIPKEFILSILSEDDRRRIYDESTTNRRLLSPIEESSGVYIVEESSGVSPPAAIGDLCYDIEKNLLESQIDFEAVCVNAQKTEDQVKFVLKKYHLWLVENSKYPKAKLPLIAGLQKWILNEKNYPKNGKVHPGNSSNKPIPTGNVSKGGFGHL